MTQDFNPYIVIDEAAFSRLLQVVELALTLHDCRNSLEICTNLVYCGKKCVTLHFETI